MDILYFCDDLQIMRGDIKLRTNKTQVAIYNMVNIIGMDL